MMTKRFKEEERFSECRGRKSGEELQQLQLQRAKLWRKKTKKSTSLFSIKTFIQVGKNREHKKNINNRMFFQYNSPCSFFRVSPRFHGANDENWKHFLCSKPPSNFFNALKLNKKTRNSNKKKLKLFSYSKISFGFTFWVRVLRKISISINLKA